MIEFLLKLSGLLALMMLWGIAWAWAVDKDEREFQEYLDSIDPYGINPYGITKKGVEQ